MSYEGGSKKREEPSRKRDDQEGKQVSFGEIVATLVEEGHSRYAVLYEYAFPEELHLYFEYAMQHKLEDERNRIIGTRFAFGAKQEDWRRFVAQGKKEVKKASLAAQKKGKTGVDELLRNFEKLGIKVVRKKK